MEGILHWQTSGNRGSPHRKCFVIYKSPRDGPLFWVSLIVYSYTQACYNYGKIPRTRCSEKRGFYPYQQPTHKQPMVVLVCGGVFYKISRTRFALSGARDFPRSNKFYAERGDQLIR